MMRCFLFCALFMGASFASAADVDGKFAVKGAGRKACSDFLSARSAGSNDYLLYAGWVEGFLSSYNQFQPNNYDITPWQTTELLMVLVAEQCTRSPDSRILSVVNGLVKAFFAIRLSEESQILKVSYDGRDTYYYSEIIRRVKERLKYVSGYQGDVNSDAFGAEEIRSIVEFQKAAGLNVTRILDQETLSALFLKATASRKD